jgi:formamidopyrimidine-DNA glycosylase
VPRDEFISLMEARRGRLKPLLMHQQVIAGIGNIYANEILFRTKLHPNRKVSRLREAAIIRLYDTMQTVLRDAISCGGSSVKDFFAPDDTEGHYSVPSCLWERRSALSQPLRANHPPSPKRTQLVRVSRLPDVQHAASNSFFRR